jgi:hypothetical protein
MPNYSLVIDAKYDPINYQDRLANALSATQAHQTLEDAYTEYGDKAGLLGSKLNKDLDPILYGMYDKYYTDLESKADELSKHGLRGVGSRKAMLDMKRRFTKEITPIDEANKKREEEIKRQQTISDSSKGKTVFSRDARKTSLDSYYLDNVQDFRQVNLDDVMTEGLNGGKAISSRNIKWIEDKAFKGDYFMLVKQQGYDSNQALEIIKDSGKYPEFNEFINETLNKYNAGQNDNTYSEYDKQRINNALLQGINMGIAYDENKQTVNNWRAQEQLQYSHQVGLENLKHKHAKELIKMPSSSGGSNSGSSGGSGTRKFGMPTGTLIFGADHKVTQKKKGEKEDLGQAIRYDKLSTKSEKWIQNRYKGFRLASGKAIESRKDIADLHLEYEFGSNLSAEDKQYLANNVVNLYATTKKVDGVTNAFDDFIIDPKGFYSNNIDQAGVPNYSGPNLKDILIQYNKQH